MTSIDFKREAYAQETPVALITLLTLTVSGITESVRVCDVPVVSFPDLGQEVWGVVSNNQRFIYLPFEFYFPRDDKTGTVSSKLRIQNVDRSIVRYARKTLNPIHVRAQAVLSNNPDVIEADYDNFQLKNVSYDGFVVEGEISLEYLGNEPFPSGRFTPSGFPGLF